MKKIYFTIIYILLFNSLLISQVNDKTLFDDTFSKLGESWSKISVNGTNQGIVKSENGSLVIDSTTSNYFGVYNNKAISGHFVVDLKFAEDWNIGLALIKENNGKPDLNNYTILCVDKKDSNVIVEVRDFQNSKKNVLDYTGKTNFDFRLNDERKKFNIGPDLYKHVLTGKQYSIPFTETNKTIRIFHGDNADFFHYYYQVSKEYKGQNYTGWMELRPSPDWTKSGSKFFVAVLALHNGEAVFKKIKVVKKPTEDKDDTSTGFKITQREYNWSGFFGDAYVVTFDNRFPFHDKDIKFVFWTEMNYIPAWHLNNQLLYTYEFVETWDKNLPGCNEPMSDRLRLWTRVEVLEDNPVRKVLKWHYVLANPNYEIPDEGKGEQLPEVDEYWTFYPDGSGTRRIIYTPKLDTDFRAPHELGELISVAGSKSNSYDFYDSPALSIMNLNGEVRQAHPGPKFDYYSEIDNWKQQILVVHFKNEPDVFCALSTDPLNPETFSGYKIRFENAWQNPNGKIVHWPVNKRPYTSANFAGGTWKGEVSHASLLSFGVRDGIDWKDNYKINDNGRKYREWVSLVGLNKKDNNQELMNRTSTWLFKGEVKTRGENINFVAKDYKDNSFLFKVGKDTKEFDIKIIPEDKNTRIINPVIKISGWNSVNNLIIFLNGREVDKNNFRKAYIGNDLYIWLSINLSSDNILELKRNL